MWCSEAKRRVLTFLDLPQSDLAQLTHDPSEAGLHVTGWGMRPDQLQQRFLKAAQAAGVQVRDGDTHTHTATHIQARAHSFRFQR